MRVQIWRRLPGAAGLSASCWSPRLWARSSAPTWSGLPALLPPGSVSRLWRGRSCSLLRRTPRLASCSGCCCDRTHCCWRAALLPLILTGWRGHHGTIASTAASESRSGWSWPVAAGAGIMILTQLVMVAIMTMTPIHIEHHGHGLGITGVVIAAHVAGMFLPSPFSGWLVDRFGYLPIAAAAGVILLLAGLLAAWAPVDSVATLVLALVLLGLGWNLGLVSGTTLVTNAVPLATRARTQGAVDFGVSLAGAGAGLSSGLIFTATSYATLTLVGGILGLLIIPIAAMARVNRSRQAA